MTKEDTKKDLTGVQSDEVENSALSKNTLTTVYTDDLEAVEAAVQATAGSIVVSNSDDLLHEAKKLQEQAERLVVTEDAEKQANTTATMLNKRISALDAKRKEIKAVYMKPYDDFAEYITAVQTPLADGRKCILDATKIFKAERAEDRKIQTDALIAARAAAYEIKPDDITVDQKWYNATYKGGERQRGRDISEAAKAAVQGLKYRAKQRDKVQNHADELHIDATGWLTSLENVSFDADAVLAQMDEAQARQKHERTMAAVDEETGEIKQRTRGLRLIDVDDVTFEGVCTFCEINGVKFEEVDL